MPCIHVFMPFQILKCEIMMYIVTDYIPYRLHEVYEIKVPAAILNHLCNNCNN